MRVTAGGLVPPRKVLVATWLAFGIAVAAGAYLIAIVGWELLAIGAAVDPRRACSTPAVRAPTDTRASASCSCSAFFGVVAVAGSYYVQTEELSGLAFALAVPVGLLAAAILMVNNIRDIDTDRRAGKRTLAVRLGRAPGAAPVRGHAGAAFAFIWTRGRSRSRAASLAAAAHVALAALRPPRAHGLRAAPTGRR